MFRAPSRLQTGLSWHTMVEATLWVPQICRMSSMRCVLGLYLLNIPKHPALRIPCPSPLSYNAGRRSLASEAVRAGRLTGMQCLGWRRCCPLLQVEQLEGAELADFLQSLMPEGWDRSKAVADRPPKRSADAVGSRLQALPVCACTVLHC